MSHQTWVKMACTTENNEHTGQGSSATAAVKCCAQIVAEFLNESNRSRCIVVLLVVNSDVLFTQVSFFITIVVYNIFFYSNAVHEFPVYGTIKCYCIALHCIELYSMFHSQDGATVHQYTFMIIPVMDSYELYPAGNMQAF